MRRNKEDKKKQLDGRTEQEAKDKKVKNRSAVLRRERLKQSKAPRGMKKLAMAMEKAREQKTLFLHLIVLLLVRQ